MQDHYIYLNQYCNYLRTIGFTIPHPNISSHFPFSDNISTSADGSVNGKYDGLNLISISSPNIPFE